MPKTQKCKKILRFKYKGKKSAYNIRHVFKKPEGDEPCDSQPGSCHYVLTFPPVGHRMSNGLT